MGIGLVLILAGAPAVAATHLPGYFGGNAAATSTTLTVGPLSTLLGALSQEACACEGTNGKTWVDTVGPINGGLVLQASAATTTTFADRTATSATEINTASVANLSLLGGMITADALKAVAHIAVTNNTMTLTTDDTTFTNLTIAGKTYPANVKPNTVIPLPGLGSVTINEQLQFGGRVTSASLQVAMLKILIDAPNKFGFPVGTIIVVGHAGVGYDRIEPAASQQGSAFATYGDIGVATLDNEIRKGANITLTCRGTLGKTIQNSVDLVSIPKVLTVDNATTSAFSGWENGGMTARMVSNVETLNLLNGLIQASNITAVAQEALVRGTVTGSVDGSSFGALKIAGVPIPVTVKPNTTIPLLGLGSVIVNEQVLPTKPGETAVSNGLHIKITAPNLLGLPIGAQIFVAHAEVDVRPFQP